MIDHRRQFPAFEQAKRPLQGIGYHGGVKEDTLVLVPRSMRSIMIVGIHPEAIEGEQLDLLSGHVAQNVDRHVAVLPNLPHLQTKADRPCLDHLRAPVMGDRVPPLLRHVVGNSRQFIYLLGDERRSEFARERVVPGAPQHGGSLGRSCVMVQPSGFQAIGSASAWARLHTHLVHRDWFRLQGDSVVI